MHIQRSMLILPANVPRFIEKAHQRGADAILLDLEDAVPAAEKDSARSTIRDSVKSAARGAGDVLVRINNEPDHLIADIEAAVFPRLHGIFIPKVESADRVETVDAAIARLEKERGMAPGSVALAVHIESPRGMLAMTDIARASDRIESMSIGVDDYCLELGVEPSEDGTELFLAFATMVAVCCAHDIIPLGILGSVSDYKDLQRFERAALRGRALGCKGAYCIHPGQVNILNRVFGVSPESIDHAKKVEEAFESAVSRGRASLGMDGMMVDTPVYKRALQVLERARGVAVREAAKAEALSRIESMDSGS